MPLNRLIWLKKGPALIDRSARMHLVTRTGFEPVNNKIAKLERPG